MTTGLLYHPGFLEHGTGPNHPEHAGRLTAIMTRLEASGLLSELDTVAPELAPLEAIEAIHDPAYVRELEQTCRETRVGLSGGQRHRIGRSVP